MPSVVQCQTCCLAFNTGIRISDCMNVYSVCYSCGTTHELSFQLVDGQFSLIDCLVDTQGPRRLPVWIITHSAGIDLTLCAPVADPQSLVPYFHVPTPPSKSLDSIVETLSCGRCHDTNLRTRIDENRCPSCHEASLRIAGSWT